MAEKQSMTMKGLVGDLSAGAIIATSNIALAVSFAAAIFQGDLAAGFTIGVWVMLITMIVVGLIIGFLTTLQPIAGGPDTAVIAVIGLMAPAVAAPLFAAGMSLSDVLAHVFLGITLVALASGVLLLFLGCSGLGQSLRFAPFPLVAGFLAATGILLISFSIQIVTNEVFSLAAIDVLWSAGNARQVVLMFVFALTLAAARAASRSPLVTPVAFFGSALALNWVLHSGHLGDASQWYLFSANGLPAWVPASAVQNPSINWSVYLSAWPELITCVIVGLISLIVRISTFESGRMAAANLNHELRIYGGSSLLSGISGGMTGGILFSTSKFLADSSAKTRFVYIVIAALLALTIFADLDLAQLIPTPILGGFLLLLGYTMTAEAFKITLRQRAGLEIFLTIMILLLCLWQGFIIGVIAGFVAACLLFAFSYARIGVIRRHSTRERLAGATERAHEIDTLIRQHGKCIHVYELEGYVFFGSSEAVFEQIRRQDQDQADTPIRSIILDLSRVTGYDSSAINTLSKLRGYCEARAITLIICGIDRDDFEKLFVSAELSHGPGIMFFTETIEALDWAEESLLRRLQETHDIKEPSIDIADWLSAEFGTPVSTQVTDTYFKRIDLAAGAQLYAQGDAADSIDFIASGTVAVMLELPSGQLQCVRRSSRRTVTGEMGFFRQSERTATVIAETEATIYSLSRTEFERLRTDHPSVHWHILNFAIRLLADRLEMATAELSSTRYVDTDDIPRK